MYMYGIATICFILATYISAYILPHAHASYKSSCSQLGGGKDQKLICLTVTFRQLKSPHTFPPHPPHAWSRWGKTLIRV